MCESTVVNTISFSVVVISGYVYLRRLLLPHRMAYLLLGDVPNETCLS